MPGLQIPDPVEAISRCGAPSVQTVGYMHVVERFPVVKVFDHLAQEIYATAKEKGWYDQNNGERNDFEMLALVHSEVSEIVEALRKGNPVSEKIGPFSSAEDECADVIIRLLDQGRKNGWNIGGAILAKMMYNKTREYRHGNKLA